MKIELMYKDIYQAIVDHKEACDVYKDTLDNIVQLRYRSDLSAQEKLDRAMHMAEDALE